MCVVLIKRRQMATSYLAHKVVVAVYSMRLRSPNINWDFRQTKIRRSRDKLV